MPARKRRKRLWTHADDFLNKPIHCAELITRVRSLLRLKEYQEKTAPPADEQENAAKSETETEEKEQKKEKPPPSVLFIEGDSKDDALIGDCRDDQKYQIRRCQDGKEAISIISQEEMDLLILNLPLPGTDAEQLCRRLKELEKTKNIQIMVVTSQDDLENAVKIMESGADDFMVKPVEKNVLKTRIGILLNKKKAADRLSAAPGLVTGVINDTMLGLYAREYFDRQLNLEIKRSLRQKYSLTLMMIHVDILERDDDSFGGLTRDQIISQYGQVLKRCIREEDFAAYYDDEQFAALLPFLDKNNADNIADRIQKAINEHEIFSRGTTDRLPATATLGFACCPSDACSTERLFQRAAAALRKAQKKANKAG